MKNHNYDPGGKLKCPATLAETIEYLNLPLTLKNLDKAIESAGTDNLSHRDFLFKLLSDEAAAKFGRQVNNRLAQAKFPAVKTIDVFDFKHPTSIPRQKVLQAFDLTFLIEAGGLVFIGPTGVGKTHLALALGYKAAGAGVRTLYSRAVDMINHLIASQADHSLHKAMKCYSSPRLLIIDEVGYLPFDKEGSDHFFNVISSRYEKGSTLLTSNRAFRDWGKIFHDNTVAAAIIDRLVHHSEVIKIEGSSYRLKDRKLKDPLTTAE